MSECVTTVTPKMTKAEAEQTIARVLAADDRCKAIHDEAKSHGQRNSVGWDIGRFVADLLLAAECWDAALAARLFCYAGSLDVAEYVERAERLAVEWTDSRSGIHDTVGEPFSIASWHLGNSRSRRKFSNFDDAEERDAHDCPLRAGEIAAEIAGAVWMFICCTESDTPAGTSK